MIRPIWTRLQDGQLSTWTAIVDPGFVNVEELKPLEAELDQNFPNPFTESTYMSFKLRKDSYVSLKVYDQLGREVATMIDGMVKEGKHVEHFDASGYSLTPGVYYFSLVSDRMNLQRKMILQ